VRGRAFSPGEIAWSVSIATLIQGGIVVLLLLAHSAGGFVPRPEPPPREMAIAVKPMLDLPLLKQGGKPRQNKLPDMWKPPQQIKRVEQKSVPSTQTKRSDPIPDSKVAKADEKPPPPDAPVAKHVDEPLKVEREEEEDAPNVPEEGTVDGAEEGTEPDPLKARAVDQYRIKLTNWFKQGFSPPNDEVDCETLKNLQAKVTAHIGPDRTVASYDMVPSGNEIFDARVRRVMEGRVGQPVPPPPPNYPDILGTVAHPTFLGKNEKCK
jgi:hypothetical protein